MCTFTVGCGVTGRGRQYRGSSECSLQMVVLLGQLLQSLFQTNSLLPLDLESFLPPLTVSLSQGQEVPTRLNTKHTHKELVHENRSLQTPVLLEETEDA